MEEKRYQVPENFSGVAEEREFWVKIVADQVASGIGAETFCEQHKLNFSRYHYWKYRKIRPDYIGTIAKKNPKIKRACQDKKVNKFIALQISPEPASIKQQTRNMLADRDSKTLEILFKNGHKIIVSEAIIEINVLIKAVGELGC